MNRSCPGCRSLISHNERECPSCHLNLVYYDNAAAATITRAAMRHLRTLRVEARATLLRGKRS